MVRCFTIWIIRAGKFCLNILYGILKVFPVKPNKVLFLSRQSDELSLDFSMLRDELRREMPDIEIRAICNRLDDSGSGLLGFAADTLRSMYCEALHREGELLVSCEWFCKCVLNLSVSTCNDVVYITDHFADLSFFMADLVKDLLQDMAELEKWLQNGFKEF